MIFISILTLIVAKALPSLNSNLSSIYFTRISAIIFVYAGVLSFNSLYIQSIGSGIGIYSGLFHVTQVSHIIEVFLLIIGSFILIAWPLIQTTPIYKGGTKLNNKNITGNTSNTASVEREILLDTNTSNINYSTDYSLIVLFSTMGATLLISNFDLISKLLYIIKNFFLENYNLNLSLISLLKLIIIIILIVLHFYLIRVEYNNSQVCEYKYKCSGPNIKIKEFYTLLAANIGLYASILGIKDHHANKNLEETKAKLEKNKNEINTLKEDIQKDTDITLEMKNKIVAGTGRLSVLGDTFIKDTKAILTKNQEIVEKHKTLDTTSDATIKSKILKEIEMLQQDLSYREKEARKSMDSMRVEADNIKETNLGSADPNSEIIVEKTIFNPFNLFENLDIFEKIAVSLLFSNSVIISSLISIVYIFYGDILLEKFNLEQRYPKLAHLINLRRKFQRYYLFLAVLFIFMSSLSQILFCLAVLNI